MKKVISIILSLVMLFSLLPMQTFAAEQYTDTAGNWAEGAIDRWSEYGVIEGSNGRFDPNGTLTRAQMAAILSRLLALPEAKNAGFSDVAQTDWFAPYINSCYAAGIMQGSDGKAQPNDPITREQAIVMLSRALGVKPIENADLSGYTDALTVSDWAKGYVAAMAQAGIVKGTSDTTVSPMASIDRAATVTILDRAIGTYANVDGAEITAADSGIILITADNVKVTGAAKNATVIVSPSADGVTVNGAAVAAGTTTTAAEEKQDKPVISGGGGGGGSPTPSYSDLTISEAKTVTGGTYKDVTITSAVGNGDVTLNNVTIMGKLIVEGGGSNSIHLDGCKVDTIQVNKDTTEQDAQQPRIELNNTPVQTIEAVQPVIIEADTESTVKAVEAKSNVTVQGAATKVESVSVPKGVGNVKLTVDGAKVKTVAAEKPVTIEATVGASPIESVTAKDNVTVDGAKIDTVTVPKDVNTKPKITVTTGAVSTVEAKSEIKVEGGNNTVANVKAEAPVEVASAAVTTITVTVQVTVTVTGDQPVEVAVATTQNVNITAESATVAVSTTVETGVDVKLNEQPVTHIHKWTKTSETPATCSATGSVTYTCSGAGNCDVQDKAKTETLPKLAHKEVIDDAVAATCTGTGLTAGKHCSVPGCTHGTGDPLVAQQIVPALGHKYGTATYTWAKDGNAYKCTATRICTHDASHKETETVTATYAVTTPAACETNGVGTYTATFTNEAFAEQTKTEEIAALGHDYTVAQHDNAQHWMKCSRCDSTTAKTDHSYDTHSCTETAKCKGCDYVKPAGQHSYGAYTQTEASTCTEKGSEHAFCSVCQHEDVREVAALGHSWATEFTIDTPATCTTVGSKSHHCTRCDAKDDVTEIPATGHSFATEWSHDDTNHWHAATCAHTEEKSGLAEHSWNNGKVTTPATGTQDGVMTYTCTVCGATKTETIPASYASVSTPEQLAAAMSSESTLLGAELAADLALNGTVNIPAGKTLIVPAGRTLTVTDELRVYGTLENKGTISNQVLIDVFGGATLTNSGTITGVKENPEDTVYASSLGIEGGAMLTNNGTINDCIAVADYFGYGANKETKTCTVTGNFDNVTPGNLVKMAVAFGAGQVKSCLTLEGYNVVVPVGSDIDLGNITIPAGKLLLLKASVFDGTQTYENNSVTIGNLTAQGGNGSCGCIEVLSGGSLTVTGTLTLATSSVVYWMTDSGSIQVQKGGSLKIGDVQYTGGGGALTLSDDARLVLYGLPKDAATEAKPTGIFACLPGSATVAEGNEFIVPNTWDNFILFDDSTLTVNGTLTNNGRIENRGTLNVYGTLNNEGGIDNQNFIDVIGGTLSNSGVIHGMKEKETDERYASNIAIESGASIYSNFGGADVNDRVTVADYWRNGEPEKKCTWDAAFDPASDNFDVMALAFGTEQVQAALNAMSYWGENNEHSAYTYEYVMACGTTPWDETNGTVNTVELGDIEVHEFGALLLKDEVFDGTNVYRNRYVISEDKTLTLQKGAALVGRSMGENSKVDLKIDGEIVNNGGFINFNQFTLSGENKPVIVDNADALATELASGGTIYLLPFAQEQKTRVEIKDDTGKTVVSYESQYHVSVTEVGKGTELVKLGDENEPVAVFFDNGFTVNSGVNLKINDLNIVAVKDSTVNGTVEARNGIVVVQGEANGATLTNEGTIVIGGENEWAALAIFDGSKPNKIVNNGTIESYGDLVFDRDRQKGQFEGNEPIEYASLRDLVCELYHRFDRYPNMTTVDFETRDPQNEEWIVDLHWVYDYPDGGSQLFRGGNDPDFEAIAAFSWLIKNGIIPEYNETDNRELRPYDLVTKEQAAELLNKLATRIKGSNVTVTLTGDGLICKTAVNGRSELDDCVIAVRKAIGENIVQNADELATALANGGKIYLLPFAEDQRAEVIFKETGEKSYESQYRISNSNANYPINENTELIKLGDENEPVAVFFDDGFTVNSGVTLKINGLNIVAVKDSVVDGTVEAHNGIVVVQGEAGTMLTISTNGKIVVGQPNEWGALAIFAEEEVDNKIVNNGTIENFGDLIFERDQQKGQFEGNEPIEYANYADVARELYHRFNAYNNMAALEENDTKHVLVKAYPDHEQMMNAENPNESDNDALDAFSWFIKNGIIPQYNEETNPKLRPYDRITKTQAADLLNKLGKKIAGKDGTYSTLSGDTLLCRTDNIEVQGEDWKTSELHQAIDELEAALPLPTVNEAKTYQLSCELKEDGDWIEVIDGQSDNIVRNLHFTKAVAIECITTKFEEGNNWGGKIRFENCQFDADVTVSYNDNCRYCVDFTSSCTFGSAAAVKVVKGDEAKLFRDVRVELCGLPEGAVIDASAPVDVNSGAHGFTLNGLPVVGGACVDFDCNANHGESNYESIDHGIKCDSSNYCLRVEIYEGSTVTIDTGEEIDVSKTIPRLNNAGTITVSGSLTANEVNNQCWWNDDTNEGRTPHLVKGCIAITESGTLTVTRLNNEERWDGEGDDAHKTGEAIFTNNGTFTGESNLTENTENEE